MAKMDRVKWLLVGTGDIAQKRVGPALATAHQAALTFREAAEEGARIVLLTDAVPADVPATLLPLRVPAFGEDLFPFTSWMSLGVLLNEVACRRGLEAGVVRRIGKVTRTE